MSTVPTALPQQLVDQPVSTSVSPSPVVSVIIPNYNHAQYLGDAIRSVLAQTYHYFEIIVVDDGSTDNSREVIAQFGDQVQYIYQKNAGLSAARNTGIKASSGCLIGVLDADDMYEPEYLNTLVSTLQENTATSGIYCGYQFVDQMNNFLPQIESRLIHPDKLYSALLDGNFLVPESVLLRRQVYDAIGLFDESLRACEDWDVWLRATKKHHIICTNKVLTRHRILAGSMSTDPLRMLDNRLAVLKKHVGDEPVGSGSSIAHRAYGRAYLVSCLEYLQYKNQDRAFECFQKMANLCPTLLTEIDTFYQLGCGEQPKGYMGDLISLDIRRSSVPSIFMLKSLFNDPGTRVEVLRLRHAAYARVFFVLGMLAYNVREFSVARGFFLKVVITSPPYLLNMQLLSLWSKSLLGPGIVQLVSVFRRKLSSFRK